MGTASDTLWTPLLPWACMSLANITPWLDSSLQFHSPVPVGPEIVGDPSLAVGAGTLSLGT